MDLFYFDEVVLLMSGVVVVDLVCFDVLFDVLVVVILCLCGLDVDLCYELIDVCD